MVVIQHQLDGSLEGQPSRVSFGIKNSKEKTLEWVTKPPASTDKRSTLQPQLAAMAQNKGRWLLLHRAASSRTTVYYLRRRYPELEVVWGQDETTPQGKWDIYARHREDA